MAHTPGKFDLIDVHFNVTLPVSYDDDQTNQVWYTMIFERFRFFRDKLEEEVKLINPEFEVEFEF